MTILPDHRPRQTRALEEWTCSALMPYQAGVGSAYDSRSSISLSVSGKNTSSTAFYRQRSARNIESERFTNALVCVQNGDGCAKSSISLWFIQLDWCIKPWILAYLPTYGQTVKSCSRRHVLHVNMHNFHSLSQSVCVCFVQVWLLEGCRVYGFGSGR